VQQNLPCNYGGIFNFYSPGRGYELTALFQGDFTGDDLYKFNMELRKINRRIIDG